FNSEEISFTLNVSYRFLPSTFIKSAFLSSTCNLVTVSSSLTVIVISCLPSEHLKILSYSYNQTFLKIRLHLLLNKKHLVYKKHYRLIHFLDQNHQCYHLAFHLVLILLYQLR